MTSTLDEVFERVLNERIERVFEDFARRNEIMNAKEAAEYLRISKTSFSKIARSLPRHEIGPQTILYVRAELLAWLKER